MIWPAFWTALANGRLRCATLALCDEQGKAVRVVAIPGNRRGQRKRMTICERAAAALEEAFRWGEPSTAWQDAERLMVAAPVSLNQRLIGGIVIQDIRIADDVAREHLQRVNEAGWLAQRWLLKRNATNIALLNARQSSGRSETGAR